MEDEGFQTLLEQVRDLHRRTDELTRSKTRIHESIRAQLSWGAAPSLPSDQRELADEVVEVLGTARLSTAQSRQLWQAYFGRSGPVARRGSSGELGGEHKRESRD
jgi:hypothetical protein